MEQRKQFTQEEFEQMQKYVDHELTRWPKWLHALLSTHGEVHHHRDNLVNTFTSTMHVLGYQPSSIVSWGRSFQPATGRIIWVLRTRNFPGPNVQKATGDEFYQFFLMTSAQGLLGVMKTGQCASFSPLEATVRSDAEWLRYRKSHHVSLVFDLGRAESCHTRRSCSQ